MENIEGQEELKNHAGSRTNEYKPAIGLFKKKF